SVLIAGNQRIGVAGAGERPMRTVRDHGRRVGESWRDIQIDDAPVLFINRRIVFPTQSNVERQRRADAPIVGDRRILDARAEILVGITEGDRGRIGNTEQEASEVIANCCAIEREASARILLRELIELLAADIALERYVMRAVIPEDILADADGLVADHGTIGIV